MARGFYERINLRELDLSNNLLTGEIPNQLGELRNLRALWLSNNLLTGEVPVELGNLPDLEVFDINLNVLSGCVPDSLKNVPHISVGELEFCEDVSSTSGADGSTPAAAHALEPRAQFPYAETSAVRGVSGDLWADVILGQPDFSQITPNQVVPFKVFNPGGIVVDRSTDPGRAYIWDAGNSRILGIDLAECYAGASPCSADIVLGQPSSYDHSACNGDGALQNFPARAHASAATLCGVPDVSESPWEHPSFVTMAVDDNSNLYVPDVHNNRVLRYNDPFENDPVADEIWGQTDYAGIMCNRGDFLAPTAESICFVSWTSRGGHGWWGSGVEVGPGGNMWVADSGNNRVLRFPKDSYTERIAKSADLVLGQPDFRSSKPSFAGCKGDWCRTEEPGKGIRGMYTPAAVRVDAGGVVYVVETHNDRVLVFEPPLTSGMAATREFGSRFENPNTLEIDPLGRGLWVGGGDSGMIELWDWSGTEVLMVVGKDAYDPEGRCTRLCDGDGGIGIDRRGDVLVSNLGYEQDVLRFPTADLSPAGSGVEQPDKSLFSPPISFNFMSSAELYNPQGLVAWGDQLVVSDAYRLAFWNGLESLSTRQPPDGIVGDEFIRDRWDHCCHRIKADEVGRLWVVGPESGAWLDVYQLPLNEYSVPIHTVLTPEVTMPVLGSDHRLTFGRRIFGIAPVGSGEFLWLSDSDHHRVVRIRDPLTNPVVDVILGQTGPEGVKCNRQTREGGVYQSSSADTLCFPGALSLDRHGNLFVSDHSMEIEGNLRLLVFPKDLFPPSTATVIYAPAASKVFEKHGRPGHIIRVDDTEFEAVLETRGHGEPHRAATFETAFDSQNRMVVGYNMYAGGRFVGVYDDPLGPDTEPTAYLKDFWSMAYTAIFDDNDNLYVGDTNRARVLVYWNPFNNPEQPSEPSADDAGAPVPIYQATITSVDPQPSSCVVRDSSRVADRTLDLVVDGLSASGSFELQIRKVGSVIFRTVTVRPELSGNGPARIRLDDRDLWRNLWPLYERATMTARMVGPDGGPISNWSPAFLLADDLAMCGAGG